MSEKQKKLSEKKHKIVHNFLVKQFPKCEVKYNGVEGHDHHITFNDKTTVLETKTCKRIIKSGAELDPSGRSILLQKVRLGQFKFDQRKVYPYEPKSQHQELVDNEGWYIFVVGSTVISGISAKDIDFHIGGNWKIRRIAWCNILCWCYPDWLKQLKMQVYGI